MRRAFDTVAQIISSGRQDAESLSWAELRYQHTAAIRTALMERYAPACASLRLPALQCPWMPGSDHVPTCCVSSQSRITGSETLWS